MDGTFQLDTSQSGDGVGTLGMAAGSPVPLMTYAPPPSFEQYSGAAATGGSAGAGEFMVQTDAVRSVASTVESTNSSASSAAGEFSSMNLSPMAFGQFGSSVGSASQSLQQQWGQSLQRMVDLITKINENVRTAASNYDTADQDVAQGYGGGTAAAPPTTNAKGATPADFDKLRDYMTDEMKNNSSSWAVSMLKGLNAQRTDSPMTPEQGEVSGYAGMEAYALWTYKVGPHMAWDHKSTILDMTTARSSYAPIDGLPGKEIRYDFWSNMHYGYVGVEAGFSQSELHWGADTADRLMHNGQTDPGDQTSIQLGMDMHDRYTPQQLTPQIIQQEIINRAAELERTGMIRNITPPAVPPSVKP